MTEPATNPERESIRARLLKVLRLAQQGVGGERENAETLLEKLLRKHSMSMADLEESLDQPRTLTWLSASTDDERTVCAQLVLKMFGFDRKVFQNSGSHALGVDVTPSEHAALTIAWDVYRIAFTEARQALVVGFCFKHGLYASEGEPGTETSPEALARMAQALALAEALPVVDPPTRRISHPAGSAHTANRTDP